MSGTVAIFFFNEFLSVTLALENSNMTSGLRRFISISKTLRRFLYCLVILFTDRVSSSKLSNLFSRGIPVAYSAMLVKRLLNVLVGSLPFSIRSSFFSGNKII